MAIDPDAEQMMRNLFFASIHQISEADHNLMRIRFFGANPPVHKSFSGTLFFADNQADDRILRLTVDYAKNQNNNDIVDPMFGDPTDDEKLTAPEPVLYSVKYLKGLNFLFGLNNTFIHFSKARDAENKPALVMKIMNGNRPVYFGDLTNMIP